jgi:hypothetical protein
MIGNFSGTVTDAHGNTKKIHHFPQVLAIARLQKEARLRILLKAIGHPEALDYLKTYNVGAGNLYHNTQHCIGVAHYAVEIAATETLNDPQFAGLVLGALFHDFHHTGGNQQVPDSHNIEAAVSGLHEYKAMLRQKNVVEWVNFDKVFPIAEEAIRVTEFPFIHEPKNIVQQIIRDADLLYASASADTLYILESLRCEIMKKTGTNITPVDFVKQQRSFLKAATFYTEAGRAMFDAVAPLSLDLLEAYANSQEDHNE